VVVVQSDITERKRAELELRQLANYDTLTGLANRALLMQQLGLALPKARAEGRRLAMLFVDLDRFKQINDSLGHATGDELLKAVGERMRARLPAHAFLARQGGDEFTVVIEDLAETSEAEQLARSLLDAFATPIEVRGHEVRVTPSIGIALYPEHAARPEDLLRSADAAMYAAKAAGRNTWRMFHADMAASGRLRVALEQSVARAEVSDEFSLDYQPIYHIVDRRPVAVEALLRWRHPEFGLVSPDDFVPLLEESGLIVEIGRKVLRMALGQLADWRRRGLEGLRMAVNLSALQLLRTELPGEIRQALGDAGLPGEALELELTESLLMSNPEQAIRTLAELKTIGVTIAVDDFGTGYSSLAYLKRLPIDKLKIDREFIGDLLHDPDDATIVEMIIAMARALGIRATAEGVELDGQLRFLKRHGCEEIQGFLMCRPLPAAACFEALQHAYE
jgi:diguanylate cyclase (GGDEF)-like protein